MLRFPSLPSFIGRVLVKTRLPHNIDIRLATLERFAIPSEVIWLHRELHVYWDFENVYNAGRITFGYIFSEKGVTEEIQIREGSWKEIEGDYMKRWYLDKALEEGTPYYDTSYERQCRMTAEAISDIL